LTVRATEQTFSLRDPSDAWYSFSGAANTRPGGVFQDPTGKSGRKLGDELDFEAIYSFKKYGDLSAGVSFFDPGDFVQNLTGQSNHATFAYLQYQVKFR
jgi:hypothetical protein